MPRPHQVLLALVLLAFLLTWVYSIMQGQATLLLVAGTASLALATILGILLFSCGGSWGHALRAILPGIIVVGAVFAGLVLLFGIRWFHELSDEFVFKPGSGDRAQTARAGAMIGSVL